MPVQQLTIVRQEDLVSLAMAEYLRSNHRDRQPQPIAAEARTPRIGDKQYVTVGTKQDILAVYLVRKDSTLQRLHRRRWPLQLGQ